jgi:hypothetical protein
MKISPVTGLRLAPEFPRWQIAYQKPRNPSAAYVVTAANFRKRLRAAFHRSRGHGDASFHFVLGPGRTPGPPPFSGMNSTPATRQPAPNRSSRPSRLSAAFRSAMAFAARRLRQSSHSQMSPLIGMRQKHGELYATLRDSSLNFSWKASSLI